MVFAKTSKAAARLSESIRNKEFNKFYLVIADGKFDEKSGVLEDYLLKNERTNSKVVKEGTKNAKFARLEYEVIKYNEEIDLSVLKIKLDTGRHHQIRLQLASRNHSICGDQKYGTRGRGKQISLWAYKLEFPHPITKENMSFELEPEHIGSWKILDWVLVISSLKLFNNDNHKNIYWLLIVRKTE